MSDCLTCCKLELQVNKILSTYTEIEPSSESALVGASNPHLSLFRSQDEGIGGSKEIVEEQEEEEMYLSEEFSECLKGEQLVGDLVTSPSPLLGCHHSSLSVITRSNLNKTVNEEEEEEEVTKGGPSYPDPPSRSNSTTFDSGIVVSAGVGGDDVIEPDPPGMEKTL